MTSSSALPALLGGDPVRPQGPPGWPPPDADVLNALEAAYEDGSWGKYDGGNVKELARRLAEYHGVEFVRTCGSGTFAVEAALRALKVGPGDEVILAAYDYPGNFFCVHAVGALPVLADLDEDNCNLDPDRLSAALGPKAKALIVSHLHGGVVPMRAVMAFAEAHGVAVVEDAAQCPGATVQGRKAGTWGDVGVLSFGGSKLLTAGRGGALLMRQADVYQRARTVLFRGNNVCPLSELQAAVLLPQLDKLDARNARRAESVRLLGGLLRDVPGLRPFVNRAPNSTPGYYKLGFQFDAARFGLDRKKFVAALRAEGFAFDEGFPALHVGRSPSRFRAAGDLAGASKAHAGTVVLHHPVLLGAPADLDGVAKAVRKVVAAGERLRAAF